MMSPPKSSALPVVDIPKETWCVDFEFFSPDGERPKPICMVARNFHTGEVRRVWLWGEESPVCPIPLDSSALYVAYFASAELGCHLALGWEFPECVLDLYAEFRRISCGNGAPYGYGLIGALESFGLGSIAASEKEGMRALAMRGGPYSEKEKVALLDYCQTDVDALARLLPRMWDPAEFSRALLRGRYMRAVSVTEWNGVPLDLETLDRFRSHWEEIQSRLIEEVDRDFDTFEGRTFKEDKWLSWCAKNRIPWPRLPTGKPDFKRETFRTMADRFKSVEPMKELRTTLSELRLNSLTVGRDGRNRYMASPFGAKTSRNTPSNSKSIFGPAKWIRSLIKPEEGRAVAYVDWSQQELGIAAALSGDENMMDAYRSGDPYLTFAQMAGAVPEGATKQSHPNEREVYKVASLAVLMGMQAFSLGLRTGSGESGGRRLLRQHKEVFPGYWKWSDDGVNFSALGGTLRTVYGWEISPHDPNSRSTTYRNFRLQANGADMLRIAATAIVGRGVNLCAMVHDAVLVEGPVEEIEEVVEITRICMADASRAVLHGFELGTDAEIVRFPDRYVDGRGVDMWTRILGLIDKIEVQQPELELV